jgi:hypothetical protein
MKFKLLSFLACAYLAVASSCSFKIKAKDLPPNLADYTAYNNGDTVYNDGSIKKSNPAIKVDKKEVSEIKSEKSFDVFNKEKKYNGLFYGKLNVLGRYEGRETNFASNGTITTRTYTSYYLQKRGENEIYDLTGNSVRDLVADNQIAYKKAKAGKIYGKISTASLIFFLAALPGGLLLQNVGNGEFGGNLTIASLFAIPVAMFTIPISNAKTKKAIRIYNK